MNPKAVNFINVCFLAAAYQFRDLTWKGSPNGGLVGSLSSQLGSANMVELVECRITKTPQVLPDRPGCWGFESGDVT